MIIKVGNKKLQKLILYIVINDFLRNHEDCDLNDILTINPYPFYLN